MLKGVLCKFAKSKPVSKIGLGNETGDVSKAGVVSINGVEEESNVGGLLATLRLIGDDKKALLMLDKDLLARVFNPPIIG